MKARMVLRIVLLAVVAAGIGRWGWKEFGPTGAAPAEVAAVRPDGVTVLSLHGEKRCRTCIRISDLARDEVEKSFGSQVAGGRLHWESVNYEDPKHRDMVEKYGLVSSTIVVTRWAGGRETTWQKLDEVWDLIDDEAAYRAFIAERVSAMLEST